MKMIGTQGLSKFVFDELAKMKNILNVGKSLDLNMIFVAVKTKKLSKNGKKWQFLKCLDMVNCIHFWVL